MGFWSVILSPGAAQSRRGGAFAKGFPGFGRLPGGADRQAISPARRSGANYNPPRGPVVGSPRRRAGRGVAPGSGGVAPRSGAAEWRGRRLLCDDPAMSPAQTVDSDLRARLAG